MLIYYTLTMNIESLRKINKLYFGYEEISRVMGISVSSARVTACRYVKYKLLLRVKRGIYVLRERWDSLSREDEYIIANLIQTPSYISLMTALSYYELTTQIPRDYVESIGLNRSLEKKIENKYFSYFRINKNLYSDFSREKNFFIASPEKAFVDSLYLKYLGCYNFDISSINFNGLKKNKVTEIVRGIPEKVQRSFRANGYI